MRSLPIIVLAYIASAAIGGCLFGVEIVVIEAVEDSISAHSLGHAVSIFISSASLGGSMCLIVELFIVTPIFVLIRGFIWPWLNYWSGAAIGFFFASVTAFLIFLTPVEGKFSEALGNFANGLPTLKGVMFAASNALTFGLVGGTCGLIFWAIAARLPPARTPH